MPTNKRETVAVALALTFISHAVLAQAAGGDVLGIQAPVSWAVAAIRLLAGLGIAYGFIRLMSGRHTMEGLIVMAVGALGVGKATTIASNMGL